MDPSGSVAFYGLVRDGRRFAETLQVFAGGHRVSETRTGRSWRTWREAVRENEAANRVLPRRGVVELLEGR